MFGCCPYLRKVLCPTVGALSGATDRAFYLVLASSGATDRAFYLVLASSGATDRAFYLVLVSSGATDRAFYLVLVSSGATDSNIPKRRTYLNNYLRYYGKKTAPRKPTYKKDAARLSDSIFALYEKFYYFFTINNLVSFILSATICTT